MTGYLWTQTTYLADAETTLDITPRASGRGLSLRLGEGPTLISIGLLDDSAKRLLEALQAALSSTKIEEAA